jgi:hypothetical protein
MGVFAEAVIASFDSNANITWTLAGPINASAFSRIGELTVTTRFTKVSAEEWQVAFDVKPQESTNLYLPKGLGNSLRILGGVFQSVREFLEVRQPMKLVFASKDDALGYLYESYLARRDTALAEMGYQVGPPLTEFTIQKTTRSEWSD